MFYDEKRAKFADLAGHAWIKRMKFDGFRRDMLKMTGVPNVVFSELLPMMDDVAQIQVTLHFSICSHKKKAARVT